MLYRFVYYKVQNREKAENITQETYIKAISYIKKNNVKIDKSISFLKAVSLSVLRDKWRKGKRLEMSINIDDINPEETSIEEPTENFGQRETYTKCIKVVK